MQTLNSYIDHLLNIFILPLYLKHLRCYFISWKQKQKKVSKVRVGLRGLTTIYFSLKFQKNHNLSLLFLYEWSPCFPVLVLTWECFPVLTSEWLWCWWCVGSALAMIQQATFGPALPPCKLPLLPPNPISSGPKWT
jgi:hypothetical protein